MSNSTQSPTPQFPVLGHNFPRESLFYSSEAGTGTAFGVTFDSKAHIWEVLSEADPSEVAQSAPFQIDSEAGQGGNPQTDAHPSTPSPKEASSSEASSQLRFICLTSASDGGPRPDVILISDETILGISCRVAQKDLNGEKTLTLSDFGPGMDVRVFPQAVDQPIQVKARRDLRFCESVEAEPDLKDEDIAFRFQLKTSEGSKRTGCLCRRYPVELIEREAAWLRSQEPAPP